MQEDLLLYRLFDRRKHKGRSTFWHPKNYENLKIFKVFKLFLNDHRIISVISGGDLKCFSPYFLSVSPAVTRLTVYRRLQVRELREMGGSCSQRLCVKMLWLGRVLSIIHTVNLDETCFLASFCHALSACSRGLPAYAL